MEITLKRSPNIIHRSPLKTLGEFLFGWGNFTGCLHDPLDTPNQNLKLKPLTRPGLPPKVRAKDLANKVNSQDSSIRILRTTMNYPY